ncbi:MAG TPA: molybdenum cofactor guanylyltransferase [Lacipirellulaceae bacterium]|nr:molybdenum cofactor guanylyltransferase [Lacipirellulaceae bacterium]
MRKGAIILCGGKSSRMGRDKATLPFGRELMLQRVVRLIGNVISAENTVVVAAPDQSLPVLPQDVLVARDLQKFRGPLQGIATGLGAVDHRLDAVYVTACDVPLLAPALVSCMFEKLGEFDIAVPFDGQRHHPLAAVYRPRVLPHIHMLLRDDRLRPVFLFDQVPTLEIPVDELRSVDPQLLSLANVNRRKDYMAALVAAGVSASPTEVCPNHPPTS